MEDMSTAVTDLPGEHIEQGRGRSLQIVEDSTSLQILLDLELLDNPAKYDGQRCADPLEPEYDNDGRIGILNLRTPGRYYLYSHAHGGARYTLICDRETIELIEGERFRIVGQVFDVMKANGSHYLRGREIVSVTGAGEVTPRDRDGVLFDLDKLCRFEKFDARSKKTVPCDCKPKIAAGVIAGKSAFELPELVSVSTAPILDPKTGRLIDADGYDKRSGLLLIINDPSKWPGIPDEPSDAEVKSAVNELWFPFAKFSFDSAVSRGVFLNAIITAITRPLLPTSPAVAITSPTAGSGKTLLAKCLAELAGDVPALLPDAGDREEIRKRLLAVLRENKRILILDNVATVLDSAALCAMLTAEVYQDRVLGVSETLSVPTRAMVIITGNNVSIKGDLCRRVLTSRIDPKVEAPWKRAFDLDPVQYCKENRMQMGAAGLTILRAGIQRGPKMADRTASFEVWSDSVRRAVCMVAEKGYLAVADPVESIDTAYQMDPETMKLGALLDAWWKLFTDKPVKVSQVITEAVDPTIYAENLNNPELNAAALDIAGEGRGINAQRLGFWIERNRERIVGGKRFVAGALSGKVRTWCVK